MEPYIFVGIHILLWNHIHLWA